MYASNGNKYPLGMQCMGRELMQTQRIELTEVWRDKQLLDEIRAEIKRQGNTNEKWKAWEVLLPPDLLYPMIQEVSQHMITAWSPVVDGIGIQVGEPNEIAIRFILPELKTSPVMVKSMKYFAKRLDDVIPIEVNNGNKI